MPPKFTGPRNHRFNVRARPASLMCAGACGGWPRGRRRRRQWRALEFLKEKSSPQNSHGRGPGAGVEPRALPLAIVAARSTRALALVQGRVFRCSASRLAGNASGPDYGRSEIAGVGGAPAQLGRCGTDAEPCRLVAGRSHDHGVLEGVFVPINAVRLARHRMRAVLHRVHAVVRP